MKKMILLATVCIAAITVVAQTKKPVTTPKPAAKPAAKTTAKPAAKPVAKTAATAPVLKNATDSFSYAIGHSLASFYKQQGITDINNQLVLRALTDIKNNKPLMDEMQANNCIMTRMQSIKSEKASVTKKEGEAFLAANKTKPGVITTASGLQYQVIKEGTGPKPTTEDRVKVHYQGTLIDGRIFDSSIQRGEPIEFGVTGVIAGWTEALQLMPVGSKWKLFIPSDLAYGDNQAGPDIKPGSTLIFEVELLEIVK